jgi:F420-non-reducing hydrogenase small subunit
MSDKPKVAFYWCASCGGCEETIVDLNEDVLKVVDAVDIVLWPVALDFKRRDIEAMADGEIAVSFINGAVRLSEQEEWVELLRLKSNLVVAFGSCAHLGGIPGLGNVADRELIFQRKYTTVPTVENAEKTLPRVAVRVDGYELDLPSFYDTVKTLDQAIDVDYYLPGCPPPSNLVWDAVMAILEGKLPEKGAVLAPNKALCDTCPRNETKPEELVIQAFKRVATSTPDPEECFLAQGVVDQGAKILSAIASIVDLTDPGEIEKAMEAIEDPLGTFYRFSLPGSLLGRTRQVPRTGG